MVEKTRTLLPASIPLMVSLICLKTEERGILLDFQKIFLWGGATAANQYEGGYLSGGKGLSTLDAITGGSQTEPRRYYVF